MTRHAGPVWNPQAAAQLSHSSNLVQVFMWLPEGLAGFGQLFEFESIFFLTVTFNFQMQHTCFFVKKPW